MRISHTLLAWVTVSAIGVAGQLGAQVLFGGYECAWFDPGPAPNCFGPGFPPQVVFNGLTFVPDEFHLLSVNGFIGVKPTQQHGWGKVSLDSDIHDYTADAEELWILYIFGCPPTSACTTPIAFAPPLLFKASISGAIGGPPGKVDLTFGPPQTFNFVYQGIGGTATMTVNDMEILENDVNVDVLDPPISGHIDIAPEPTSRALLATALASLIPMVRIGRRRRMS